MYPCLIFLQMVAHVHRTLIFCETLPSRLCRSAQVSSFPYLQPPACKLVMTFSLVYFSSMPCSDRFTLHFHTLTITRSMYLAQRISVSLFCFALITRELMVDMPVAYARPEDQRQPSTLLSNATAHIMHAQQETKGMFVCTLHVMKRRRNLFMRGRSECHLNHISARAHVPHHASKGI